MDVFVLDTTAFTEVRLRKLLGTDNLEETVTKILSIMREARLKLGSRFYMTPSTWNELRRMLLGNGVSLDVVQELAAWVVVKAPDKLSTRIPAAVFSEYVADVRRRLYKGLRVAESAVRKASKDCPGGDEECIGEVIRGLREKYREATRKGLVDSVEDLDTIILALETGGVLVTSDEGMARVSQQLGVVVVDPENWINGLSRMIRFVLAGKGIEESGSGK